MKKVTQRLLLFCIGLPVITAMVVFLPQRNHLAVNILVVIMSALGAVEFAGMLRHKKLALSGAGAALLGALIPAAVCAVVSFGVNGMLIPVACVTAMLFVLIPAALSPFEKLAGALGSVAAGCAVLFYPGMLLAWICGMALLPNATAVILLFLLIVIGNDSLAWAAGMLLGKNNRNVVPVSPNKSVAGFAGGALASVLISLGAVFLFPAVFSSGVLPAPAAALILGMLTGAAAVFGDLAESALKRGAGLKDSGAIMPGRGGVLDSVDSIALAAPVFYCVYRLLF
jgi:phosphatidate cytidylyltransferase